MAKKDPQEEMQKESCKANIRSIKDALDVINGKWKILVIMSILEGNERFKDIERSIPNINGKVLAKELKDLELNKLITRTVYDDAPVLIEYKALPYAKSLRPVLQALSDWGKTHRKKIMKE